MLGPFNMTPAPLPFMMALSSCLLWFLGGLRKLSGLLMNQGPPRRCGFLGGA